MATLGVALSAAAGEMRVPAGLTVASRFAPFTINSENILVTGGSAPAYSISRGQNGTAPAAHALGATVTAGWGGGGGSISATDGTTTVNPATSIRASSIRDGGSGEAILVPCVVSEDDPGAIGAGFFWLRLDPDGNASALSLYVRDDADTFWNSVGPSDRYGGAGLPILTVLDTDTGTQLGSMRVDADGSFKVDAGFGHNLLLMNGDGRLQLGGAGMPSIQAGTADPSAGAGVTAFTGSLFMRQTGGGTGGELWQKTGATDTDWTQVTVP